MSIELAPRMIHNVDGTTYDVPYGKGDQCIYSVGRRYINEALLTGKYYRVIHHLEVLVELILI